MAYEEDTVQIDTTKQVDDKEIDVDDEAVKDRWSRYIGAMGIEAVRAQARANIFLSGAGALGIEIAKNLVLAGCKAFTMHDTVPVTKKEASGQFFLQETDKGTRAEASINRLQQLNLYVKCKLAPSTPIPTEVKALEENPWNFEQYDVVILTGADFQTIQVVDEYCHSKGKKFICTDLYGVFGRVFNDFGPKFEVLDKNGEQLQDVMVKNISNEEKGMVELLPNAKHNFEDGDEVVFAKVEGMKLKEG